MHHHHSIPAFDGLADGTNNSLTRRCLTLTHLVIKGGIQLCRCRPAAPPPDMSRKALCCRDTETFWQHLWVALRTGQWPPPIHSNGDKSGHDRATSTPLALPPPPTTPPSMKYRD
eukprot:Sspe_Gene.24770::Locus_9857_Transcript_1_1_Confidence_1.000_Length_1665::g.24770::m.24770